ncbi:MAG: site-specific integrase [Novosphingobium sp.]
MANTIPATPSQTLRERMIEDMNLHRLFRATQRNYLRDVSRFATWLGRPPDTASDEDLRRYQIEQTETGFGAPAMNTAVSALRFFYSRTLDRPDLTRKLHRVKHPRALPTVLSREEVTRMLDATTRIKHQAILSVAYGAGLRASEVTKLKVRDIDSERMLLRVEGGKGGWHRHAMLAQDLLVLLREWWKVGRKQGVMHPDGWLFPGTRSKARNFRRACGLILAGAMIAHRSTIVIGSALRAPSFRGLLTWRWPRGTQHRMPLPKTYFVS